MGVTRAVVTIARPDGSTVYINDHSAAQEFLAAMAVLPLGNPVEEKIQEEEASANVESRLNAIKPVLHEKVCAAAERRQPRIAGSVRRRRNIAEHNFDIDIDAADDEELKRAQRGARRTKDKLTDHHTQEPIEKSREDKATTMAENMAENTQLKELKEQFELLKHEMEIMRSKSILGEWHHAGKTLSISEDAGVFFIRTDNKPPLRMVRKKTLAWEARRQDTDENVYLMEHVEGSQTVLIRRSGAEGISESVIEFRRDGEPPR